MNIFLEELSKVNRGIKLFMDNSKSHGSKGLKIPKGIEYLPYPELNPCERVFEEIRRSLSNKIFNDIKEVVEEEIIKILKRYYEDPELVKKLTFFPYMKFHV